MCRMENSNLDDDKTPEASSDPAENPNIEETRPIRLEAESNDQVADLGETMATPVFKGQADENELPEISDTQAGATIPKGYEETGMFPAEPAAQTPVQVAGSPPPPANTAVPSRKARRKGLPWFFYPLVGLVVLLIVLLISGFGGYASGIGLRRSAERTQVSQAVADQYALGLQDMQQGMYARARQRFEYVIQLDPNYPGVTEKLAEVLLELNTTATPTLLPTATLTPTPDTRDSQQRFDQAQQGLAANDWTATIDALLALRKIDPSYRAVEIDGMLFLALRNRGRDKILKESDLEGGIYDLTQASQFGPLDSEAQGLLSWSSLYITGASFWGIDWEQAVNYFSQVAPNLPNLMDGSKMTATERLRQALFEQGNVLAGRGQYCAAVRAYQQSYEISPDPKVQQAGELAAKGCAGAGEQPQGTPKPGKKPKATQNP
jgi:tetratricopeptide (TPR) repeat protein